jgi:hypothetical protein
VPTPSLRELQKAFWRGITRGPEAGPLRVIAPSATLAPVERLGIYSGMYVARLVDALRENFPRTAAVLGDERFAEVARAYLRRHPSTHPSVRNVGRALPAYLAAADVPGFVAELARLEWLRLEVFDAPDTPVLRREDLAAVAPEDWPALRFEPVAALETLVTRWAVHRLWKDEERTTCERNPAALRIWREGFLVYQTAMEPDEERALARVRSGECFAAVCEGFEDATAPAALLLRWVEDGILARVRRAPA